MERSIETARRRRLHDTEAPARARPMAVEHNGGGDHGIPRRKARPKRANPTFTTETTPYRAEAV